MHLLPMLNSLCFECVIMLITDVQTILLTGPCTNDPYLSEARARRSAAFVEVHTDQGIIGVGETYGGYFIPEAISHIVNFFKPVLVGQPLEDIELLCRRMYHCGNFWCRVGLGLTVISGIEAAMWDARGKVEGLPVYQLLGGLKHDRLMCYATGGPSNGPFHKLEAKIEFYMSLGFHGVKLGAGWLMENGSYDMPVGPQAAAELEGLKAATVRDRFGDGLSLMFDGHMSNSPVHTWDLETAQAVMEALTPFNLVFFEEPLHYRDLDGYAELCRTSAVPIAGGECLTGLVEWKPFIDRDCCDIGQPDASFTGGLSEVLQIAKSLADRNKRIATHAWGAGASLMQNIHLGFAAENCQILEVPPAFGPLHSELVGDSFQMESGYVLPPNTPGLGISLTASVKERFPFVPGSGEFNSVPGKVLDEERSGFANKERDY